MADLIIDVYQGTNRKCLAIGNHRISVGKPYGFLEKVESYKCDTKDILSCIGTANQWIPCSERLPEKNQGVLVCCYGSDMIIPDSGESLADAIARTMKEFVNVTVGWIGSDGWYGADFYPMMVAPTHWMPLPEPPKEDET